MKQVYYLFAAMVCAMLMPLAHGEDWPEFRGRTVQGISSEKDFPTTWSKEGENIAWKVPAPRGDNPFSSPIVHQDRFFLTYAINRTREHHVLCLSTKDGSTLWDQSVAPGAWVLTDLRGGYNAPTPCTDGQRVYALFGSSILHCLDCASGKPIWSYEIKDTAFDVAIGFSPILYNDMVLLFAEQNQKKSRLIALDKLTGKEKYVVSRPASVFAHSTPVPVTINGKHELLASSSGALEGIDPESGKVLWRCKSEGDASSPVYSREFNLVYIDSGRGSAGIAVDPTGEGDVTKTHLKWKTPTRIPESLSSAVISGAYLYRVHSPGIMRCYHLPDGKELYSKRLEGVSTWASPVVTADGLVYLVSSGTTYVIKPGPTLEILATNKLDDPTHASAAFSNGRIYLRGQKFIYCIGKQ